MSQAPTIAGWLSRNAATAFSLVLVMVILAASSAGCSLTATSPISGRQLSADELLVEAEAHAAKRAAEQAAEDARLKLSLARVRADAEAKIAELSVEHDISSEARRIAAEEIAARVEVELAAAEARAQAVRDALGVVAGIAAPAGPAVNGLLTIAAGVLASGAFIDSRRKERELVKFRNGNGAHA